MRLLLALALSLSFPAYSQPYPTKAIRLLVTYPAGGGADTMARLIAPRLSEALGQPVVVENRGGASGTIAADLVAKAAPDGYTLMLDATNHAVIAKAVRIPEVRDRMLALGGEIVASSPADLGAWVREQTTSWAKVVRAAGIKAE